METKSAKILSSIGMALTFCCHHPITPYKFAQQGQRVGITFGVFTVTKHASFVVLSLYHKDIKRSPDGTSCQPDSPVNLIVFYQLIIGYFIESTI